LDKRTESRLSQQQEAEEAKEELSRAVPPTETLNTEVQRGRAELARQGSLAERNAPLSVAARRSAGSLKSSPGENGSVGAGADVSFERRSRDDGEIDDDEVSTALK